MKITIKKEKLIEKISIIIGVVLIISGTLLFFKPNENYGISQTDKLLPAVQSNLSTESKTVRIAENTEFVDKNEWLKATISINGYPQVIQFLKEDTLFDAMNRAMGANQFYFAGKEFYGIGFFVDQIDKKKAEKGYSWIYYINGREATVGVSSYKIKEGDLIEWKYEKNY